MFELRYQVWTAHSWHDHIRYHQVDETSKGAEEFKSLRATISW